MLWKSESDSEALEKSESDSEALGKSESDSEALEKSESDSEALEKSESDSEARAVTGRPTGTSPDGRVEAGIGPHVPIHILPGRVVLVGLRGDIPDVVEEIPGVPVHLGRRRGPLVGEDDVVGVGMDTRE